MRLLSTALVFGALLLTGCLRHGTCADEPDNRFCRDAGRTDAGPRRDAGRDSGTVDATVDATVDSGLDATVDAAPDASVDAGPCDGLCSPTEVCGGDAGCVECVESEDCTDTARPACGVTNTCVECVGNPDCTDGLCFVGETPEENRCVECLSDADCAGPDQCREEGVCGPTRDCQACTADSDCLRGHDCVDMDYAGAPRGSYCLPRKVEGVNCSLQRPYGIENVTPSVDGRPGPYCGIAETNTTCEAVRALLDALPCPGGTECPEGGLCEDMVCTYACTTAATCLDADSAAPVCLTHCRP